MTVYCELRNRPDKAGLCQLRIVLQQGKGRKYYPLPFKIKPADWNQATKTVSNRYPHASLINQAITKRMAEIQLGVLNETEKPGSDKTDFFQFAMDCLNRWEKTKSEGTIKAYQSMLKAVKRVDPKAAINSITPVWLAKYEQHSLQDGCSQPGALKRVAFISTILNEAKKFGLLQSNPFDIYRKPKKINPEKVWLTMEELATISKMETDATILKNMAAWFLFACYTGLRYSDVKTFDPAKHIQNGRIILHTTKTGEVVSIAISSSCKGILDNYPKVPVYSNQKCNQYLKAIAHVCGIDKRLTFHTARHTFAVQCANLGISQEVTSKLLGHSDLRTTGIYYKVVNERIDREMAKWG